MKTLREICDTHSKHIVEEMDSYIKELKNHIKELGFDKRVIRIKDGREGELRVVRDVYNFIRADIKFYPITKNGTVSKCADGYFSLNFDKLEDEYRQKESE